MNSDMAQTFDPSQNTPEQEFWDAMWTSGILDDFDKTKCFFDMIDGSSLKKDFPLMTHLVLMMGTTGVARDFKDLKYHLEFMSFLSDKFSNLSILDHFVGTMHGYRVSEKIRTYPAPVSKEEYSYFRALLITISLVIFIVLLESLGCLRLYLSGYEKGEEYQHWALGFYQSFGLFSVFVLDISAVLMGIVALLPIVYPTHNG